MEKETNKFHALQLFTDTFSAETVHLTNEAVGIYIRLLCFSWTKNTKPFKTEPAYRICHCKTDDCKLHVDEVLEEFFIANTEDSSWTHKRLTHEHQYLSDKYKARSEAGRKGGLATQSKAKDDFASSKIKAPIPSPIPIPKSIIESPFDQFWNTLKTKKGSKHLASKKFKVHCSDLDPVELAEKFNRYSATVKDKEFLAHVSTWINQKRFDDEENNQSLKTKEHEVFYQDVKLQFAGQFGEHIEYTDNNGGKYKKHKWNGEPIEKVA
jgi:uncharacterized protein YdaU (DUF1376 family)